MFAPGATVVVWALLDHFTTGEMTAVGLATAIVVGLVAITPASGFVTPMGAIAIGALAAVPSYYFIKWRTRSSLDDSLDVFGAHGIGGAVGAVLTGVFAAEAVGGTAGLLEGNPGQVVTQVIAIIGVLVYSVIATVVILKVIGAISGGLRPAADLELRGMDVIAHGEEGYATGDGAVLILEDD
jgi:Amt family ammonium transporter